MRDIVTVPPASGRIVGDPPPLAIGVSVDPWVPEAVENAVRDLLLPGELVLAIARVTDGHRSDWRLFLVVAQHRYLRVALHPHRAPQTLEVPFAQVTAASWQPLAFTTSHGRVPFGDLFADADIRLLSAAMRNTSVAP